MNHATALLCLGRVAWVAVWLSLPANMAHAAAGMTRVSVVPNGSNRPGFTLQPAELTGVTFSNTVASGRSLTNQIYLNGSGVAAGDIDGDGRCDLLLCGLDRPNALYRNLGQWRFEDIAVPAGVACPDLDVTAAALADLDGDRDLDLVLNTVGQGTHLFLNDGHGRFAPAPGGLFNPGRAGMSLALADIDGDGDLDIYVANYRTVTIRDQPNTRFKFTTDEGKPKLLSVDGRPAKNPDVADRFVFQFEMRPDGGASFAYDENGEPDLLLRNDGAGRFTPLSFTDGTFLDRSGQPLAAAPLDWSLGAMFRDLNGDGFPDLYVCNDFRSPDRVWMNDGRGHFRPADALAFRQSCLSSMGLDVADINRDGFDDLLVVDMLSPDHGRRLAQRMEMKPELPGIGLIENWPQYPRNMLFVNRGDGTWAELAQFSGLEATDWSWTPVFLDVDLDGYEDLLLANGFERDGMNADVVAEIERLKRVQGLSSIEQLKLRARFPRLDTPNLAFRNLGNLRFEEVSDRWGFNLPAVSQGMAVADLDGDGDLDVVVNNFNGPATLYRNDCPAPRVLVRLRGAGSNTRGIGARLKISGGPGGVQSQEMICGGRYLSSDDAARTFAAGGLTNLLALEVIWRSGARSVVADIHPNEVVEVWETEAGSGLMPDRRETPKAPPRTQGPFFLEQPGLQHQHHEDPFDDFARQPCLPLRLSQLGPGVAWFDLDGDGWDDLIVGAGRGGRLGAYRNDQRGGFQPFPGPGWSRAVASDLTTVLGCRRANGSAFVLAGVAGYENVSPDGIAAQTFDAADGQALESLAGAESSTGPLAMADYSGDGWLDLFVGGRVVPGRFPEAASSLVWRGTAAGFVADPEASASLAAVGLVSGAVFTDLDGDGRPELALACHWGPLRVFAFERERWVDQTRRWGLESYAGMWNGVAAGDFDGDGRMDLVASNWGRNSRYERFGPGRLRLHYGVGADGGVGFLEAFEEAGTGRVRPLQPFHLALAAMPFIREKRVDYRSYAQSTVPEVLAEGLSGPKEWRVQWLDSTVFLNRAGRLEAVVLPDEAQWAPAFAVNVADFDGDGREDLFLSQNFFAVGPEISRLDAGRSLWLRGDGRGRFLPVGGSESGLRAYGEQRGAAVSDYDQDGRPDLVLTQNGAATKLFHNIGGQPGVRVRWRSPVGNADAVGAVVRFMAEDSGAAAGPAQEVHAGSGYWSQDSAALVLGTGGRAGRVWVRWPGGKTNSVAVPAGAHEVVLAPGP